MQPFSTVNSGENILGWQNKHGKIILLEAHVWHMMGLQDPKRHYLIKFRSRYM